MSSFNYARSQSVADGLIKRFGQSAILRAKGSIIGGPAGNPTFGPPVDYPCKVVVLAVDSKQIDGTLIQVGDKRAYISAKGLGVNPDASLHQLIVQGKAHTIIPPVEELNPAGITVYWQVIVRA